MSLFAYLTADTGWHMDMDMDGGWWIVMAVGMAIFLLLVAALLVWLFRGGLGAAPPGGSHPAPREILDRRLAEGSIDVEEYERLRQALDRGKDRGVP